MLPPLSEMMRDVTMNIRMADMSQSLRKKRTRLFLLWRMPASNLDENSGSSQPPILNSHHQQLLKKHKRIFESYKK
jgi:hypothetical protein